MTETLIPYQPTVMTSPGETLAELLEERGMTQTYLAQRTGRPLKTIEGIIAGQMELTTEFAHQLEGIFRTPATYWLSHEAHYRAFLSRTREEDKAKVYD